jgi:osmoprotectant transport system ATP-binding protein
MEEARSVGRGSEARTAVVIDDQRRLVGWVSLEGAIDGPVGAHVEKFAAQVPLGTTLRTALGEMLQHDVRWIPVLDDADRYLGVLTPNRLHAAMRRSVGGTAVES